MGFNLGKALGGGQGAMSIFMPGTQEAAGLLGLGAKIAPPDLQKAELDPNAASILEQRNKDFSLPPTEYEQRISAEQNTGIERGGDFLAGGNVDSPMRDAILKRQQKEFGSQTSKMRRSDKAEAPNIRAQRMASTLGAMRNQNANAINFAEKQKIANENKKFARANAVNAVFKNVGTGIGMVLGGYFGGPQGAKAGAQFGQTTGNAASMGVGGQTGDERYI